VGKWTFFFNGSSSPLRPRPLIQFRNHFFTDGRTSWTSDQPVARLLPQHRIRQTQNKRIHTLNIYVLSGVRNHDPSVRENKDSSCLRPRGYCDRRLNELQINKYNVRFLGLSLVRVNWSASHMDHFTVRERATGAYCTGGSVINMANILFLGRESNPSSSVVHRVSYPGCQQTKWFIKWSWIFFRSW
jgi:hypothetical protein